MRASGLELLCLKWLFQTTPRLRSRSKLTIFYFECLDPQLWRIYQSQSSHLQYCKGQTSISMFNQRMLDLPKLCAGHPMIVQYACMCFVHDSVGKTTPLDHQPTRGVSQPLELGGCTTYGRAFASQGRIRNSNCQDLECLFSFFNCLLCLLIFRRRPKRQANWRPDFLFYW